MTDFTNFMGAVIDGSSFETQRDAIAEARAAGAEIVAGGGTDDSEGWFVEPTVIKTDDPDFRLMRDELFGPVVTAYVYDEKDWDDTLGLVDRTGSVRAHRRGVLERPLRDRPGTPRARSTPPGTSTSTTSRRAPSSASSRSAAARASGTNDKAGSMWNLIRWVSPRTIKETLVPPTDYRYPFLEPDA